MPKDAKKNVDRFKVDGGHLNEFEFHQNQGQLKDAPKPKKAKPTPKKTAKKKPPASAKRG